MKAINLPAYTEDASQIEAVKINDVGSPCNPEFVAMIREGEQDLKEGKGIW